MKKQKLNFFFSKKFSDYFQLKSANKTTFLTTFQDQSLSDSMLICDLIDAIKPGSIQYNLLKTTGTPDV